MPQPKAPTKAKPARDRANVSYKAAVEKATAKGISVEAYIKQLEELGIKVGNISQSTNAKKDGSTRLANWLAMDRNKAFLADIETAMVEYLKGKGYKMSVPKV